jgi:Putative transposase
VVYAKAPFGGPRQVLDYVGRYTHRVAISNNRLLDIEDDQIQFHWKDYRDNDQQKTMTLSADELIRRFLLHVLPDGFQRIRYYGFLSNHDRDEKLALPSTVRNAPFRSRTGARRPAGRLRLQSRPRRPEVLVTKMSHLSARPHDCP